MHTRFMVPLFLLTLTPAVAQEPLGHGEAQVSPQPTVGETAFVDVAADRLGNVGVTWKRGSLFLQRYDSAGQPHGVPQELPDSRDSYRPRIGFDDEGRSLVIWDAQEGYRLAGQRFAADGQPRGGVFTIASYDHFPYGRPTLAVAPDGHFVVSWIDSAQRTVQVQRLNADDTPLGDQLTVSPPWAAEIPGTSISPCDAMATLR